MLDIDILAKIKEDNKDIPEEKKDILNVDILVEVEKNNKEENIEI
jgi:hypothetical protein